MREERLGNSRHQSSDGYHGAKSQEPREKDKAYDEGRWVHNGRITPALAHDGTVHKLTQALFTKVVAGENPTPAEMKKLCLLSGLALMTAGDSSDFKAGLSIVMRLGLKEEAQSQPTEQEAREAFGL